MSHFNLAHHTFHHPDGFAFANQLFTIAIC